ncbi:MAG: diguanylate cyclase [Burkholderiales bacterium]
MTKDPAVKNKNENVAFHDYLLLTSLNLIKGIALLIGFLHIFLIIPDFINLTDTVARVLMLVLRIAFALAAGLLFIYANRIRTFRKLAMVLTIYEIAAVFIFFFVLALYPDPDFIIQLLGVFIIIIAVFLIPNIWSYMLSLSIVIAAGFLIYSYIRLGVGSARLSASLFVAASTYLAIEIALCAIFAYYFNKYKRGEFAARAELQRIYDTDPLTKIGNRVKLENEAQKWIAYCTRHGLEISLMLIDVDNLKLINDEYGHLLGDTVLYEIADIMRAQLRQSDVCIRWGGDEFILLLPHTGIEEAKTLAERIRSSIQKHKFSNGVAVSCSFGIASMRENMSLAELIHRADRSMYQAKKKGKDNIIAVEE